MAKQQTLTIVVADHMLDPADLVERAMERLLMVPPVRPESGDNPAIIDSADKLDRYMIIEEA